MGTLGTFIAFRQAKKADINTNFLRLLREANQVLSGILACTVKGNGFGMPAYFLKWECGDIFCGG
jgi:hypothetical protein